MEWPGKAILTKIWQRLSGQSLENHDEKNPAKNIASYIRREQGRNGVYLEPQKDWLMIGGDIDAINRILGQIQRLFYPMPEIESQRHQNGINKGRAYIRVQFESDTAQEIFTRLGLKYETPSERMIQDIKNAAPYELPKAWLLYEENDQAFKPPKPWSPEDDDKGGNMLTPG